MNVAVVTPRGAVLKGQADEVVAPGVLGELGILPGHIPLLAALKPGVVVVKTAGKHDVVAVSSGYLQVGASDKVQLLVERAEAPADIDADEARREQDEALADLKKGNLSGAELAGVEAKLGWAQARLQALGRQG
jgi:F-type H+-transporting ATPase subunit epsilon